MTTITNPSCCGLMGSIFGHNFEARYHDDEVGGSVDVDMITAVLENCADAYSTDNFEQLKLANGGSFKSVYVYDVCTRCGQTVKSDEV